MIAVSNGHVIKLRWAPTEWNTWKHIIKSGVTLERYTIRRDGDLLPVEERSVGTVLNNAAIKPWENEERWKALMSEDDYAAIGGTGDLWQYISGAFSAAG